MPERFQNTAETFQNTPKRSRTCPKHSRTPAKRSRTLPKHSRTLPKRSRTCPKHSRTSAAFTNRPPRPKGHLPQIHTESFVANLSSGCGFGEAGRGRFALLSLLYSLLSISIYPSLPPASPILRLADCPMARRKSTRTCINPAARLETRPALRAAGPCASRRGFAILVADFADDHQGLFVILHRPARLTEIVISNSQVVEIPGPSPRLSPISWSITRACFVILNRPARLAQVFVGNPQVAEVSPFATSIHRFRGR